MRPSYIVTIIFLNDSGRLLRSLQVLWSQSWVSCWHFTAWMLLMKMQAGSCNMDTWTRHTFPPFKAEFCSFSIKSVPKRFPWLMPSAWAITSLIRRLAVLTAMFTVESLKRLVKLILQNHMHTLNVSLNPSWIKMNEWPINCTTNKAR